MSDQLDCEKAHARRVLGRYMSARLVDRAMREMAQTTRRHRDPEVVAFEAEGPEPTDIDVARARKLARELRRQGR